MRKIKRTELDRILRREAVEIAFIRRRPERAQGRPFLRRMLCTNSMEILNSEQGIRRLNFHKPRGGKKLNEKLHNIVVVWDIIMQDYRNVAVEACFLIEQKAEPDFWEYFEKKFGSMGASEKMEWQDSI